MQRKFLLWKLRIIWKKEQKEVLKINLWRFYQKCLTQNLLTTTDNHITKLQSRQKLCHEDNNVKNGSKIEVIAEKGKMIILPQKKSLDDMMAMVNADNIHSEISTGCAVGKEEW